MITVYRYCISSDANRSLAATKKFFQALTDCDKAVPVIVVFTKADKLYRDQQEEANKVQSDKTGKDQSKFNKKDKECVAQLCKTYQEQHETKWRIDLEQLGNVSSIVYTCHSNPHSDPQISFSVYLYLQGIPNRSKV
jgi:GTPase SAR1 family protein